MSYVFHLFSLIISLSGMALYVFRYDLREMYHNYRMSRVGGFSWYQIRAEGFSQGRDDDNDISEMGYIKSLLQAVSQENSVTSWYLDRGMFCAVWVKNPTTGLIDLFIGITAKHDAGGRIADLVAKQMGGRATHVRKPPVFPHRNPRILWRQEAKFGNVATDNSVTGKGHVVEALSQVWSNLRSGESAAVFLSAEQVRAGTETNALKSFLNESTVQKAGYVAAAPSTSDKSAVLSEGFRCCIASATNTGDSKLARDTLNATDGALTTSGWKTIVSNPLHNRNNVAGVALGVLLSLPPMFFSLFTSSWFFTWIALLPLAGSVAVPLYSAERAQVVCSRLLRRGEIAIPPYVMKAVNPLRFFIGVWNANRRVASDENTVSHNRVAEPSARQVVYLHFGAMFEFLSFPGFDRTDVDIEMNRTREIGLPPNFEHYDNESIYLGKSGRGQVVTYSVPDLVYSLFTVGAPSSGKSNFLKTLYSGCVYHAVRKTGGAVITPVWCETKGDGAYDAAKSSAMHGALPFFIDFNNPNTLFKFRLEGTSFHEGATVEQVKESCASFVAGIQAAWGDSVRSASRDAIYAYLLIAMLLTPLEIRRLGLDRVIDCDDISVIDVAYYLTGADSSLMKPGDSLLLELAEDLRSGALDADVPASQRGSTFERDMALAEVIGSYSNRLFTPAGIRTNSAVISSAQNKFGDLRKASAAWKKSQHPKHRVVTLRDLIGSGVPVVVNMGGYIASRDANGDPQYSNVDTSLSKRLVSIFNYLLWNYIKQNCNGWQAQKRFTPVFFDEVADIAQSANSEDIDDVLQTAVKEGRSYGNGYFLGCQSPSQLPEKTRSLVLGFRSKVWFNNHNPDDLKVAIQDLNSNSSNSTMDMDIVESNIRYLPNGVGMAIMQDSHVNMVTPPFTLHAPLFSWWDTRLVDPAFNNMADVIDSVDDRKNG